MLSNEANALLRDRYRNKGTAFTAEERDRFGLHGLLPPAIEDLETQLDRVWQEYLENDDDLERHVYLRSIQARNSVLFYAFLQRHLAELLPIIYTPTVGLACQQWNRIYRREHGLVLSWPLRHRVGELIDNIVGGRDVDVVVATDGERILGLGDLGIGGMGIPIGKLALYTCGAGLDPSRTLPVFLDVGTDNEALLSDPLYLGWRNRRLRDDQYDELVDAFVEAIRDRYPNVLLQWEDFAQVNAYRLLARHRDRICSFNDDIQGTAAVTTAAIVAGLRTSDVPLADLRLVVVGAGSAGVGIATQVVGALMTAGLSEPEARRRCFLVDRAGLLHDRLEDLRDFQQPFARPWPEVASLDLSSDGGIDLVETVRHARPHAIVGVTGQPGLFTEQVIRSHAAAVERPIVLPLSNPTQRAEAIPADVIAWTDGRALVGTGSPFADVDHAGRRHAVSQVNNFYVFPGVGLGVVAAAARAVSDGMLTAAATALGELAAASGDPTALLPPIDGDLEIATTIATAVARAAMAEGLAEPLDDDELGGRLAAVRWRPEYHTIDG